MALFNKHDGPFDQKKPNSIIDVIKYEDEKLSGITEAATNPIVPIKDLWYGKDKLYFPYFVPINAANASPKHKLNTPNP